MSDPFHVNFHLEQVILHEHDIEFDFSVKDKKKKTDSIPPKYACSPEKGKPRPLAPRKKPILSACVRRNNAQIRVRTAGINQR